MRIEEEKEKEKEKGKEKVSYSKKTRLVIYCPNCGAGYHYNEVIERIDKSIHTNDFCSKCGGKMPKVYQFW